MIQLVPFRKEHIAFINMRDEEKCHANLKDPNLNFCFTYYQYKGIGFTGLYNGNIVGCAGIFESSPGVGEFWMATAKDINIKYSTLKTIKQMFDIIIKNTNFEKYRLYVEENFEESIKMVKWLGFKEVRRFKEEYFNKFIYIEFERYK